MSEAMKMNRAHIYWALVPGSVLAARMAPVGLFTFKDLGGARLRGGDDFLPAGGSSQSGGFSSGMAEFWKQSQSEMPWMEEEERRILEFCLGNGEGEARSAGRSGVQREEEMQTYFWP